MAKYPVLYSGDEEINLPYKWEICGVCEGEGVSSAYLGAFTWDELKSQGEDFIEDYFAGNYDRPCDCCGGSGKVTVVDYDKMTEDQIKAYDKQVMDEIEYESMVRAEKRMGC